MLPHRVTQSTVAKAAALLFACLLASCAAAPGSDSPVGDSDAPDRSVDALTISACNETAILHNAPPAALPMLARALDWVHRGAPYSQVPQGAFGGYRTDCSGLVSHAWNLPAPGHTTFSFAGGPWDDHRSQRLGSWDDLAIGDAVNLPTEHIRLFAGWLNASHTTYCSIEEYDYGHPASIRAHSVDHAYLPIRLNGFDPVYCTAHCDGDTFVDAMCNRTACGNANHCTATGGPARCASDLCPDAGSTDVCLAGDHLGHCDAGALSDHGVCEQGCRVQDGDAPDACWVVPRGHVDSVGCDFVRGWTQDPNTPATANAVDIYIDGPAGSDAPHIRAMADQSRDDLCTSIGSCAHGFNVLTPAEARDGRPHTLYVYGASTVGAPRIPELPGSRAMVHCPLAATGDFNGDGRGDVLQYRSDWGTIPVCLSLASGWSCRNLPASSDGHSAIVTGATARVADFAGDHRGSVVQFRDDDSTLPVCRANDNAWSCETLSAGFAGGDDRNAAPGNGGSGIYRGARPLVGDFNGDGRDDVIQFVAGSTHLPVCASLGSGWSCRDLSAPFAGGDSGLAAGNDGSGVYPHAIPLTGDVNGDGRADVIQFDPTAQGIPVCASLGSGWSCRNLRATFSMAGAESGGPGNGGSGVYADAQPLVGDFNGDGRDDVIQYNPAWTTIPVCLSLGTGWSCRSLPAYYVGTDRANGRAGNAGSGVYAHATPVLADLNGDGRVDLVQYDSQASSIPVCLSTGSGWSCRDLAATLVSGNARGNADSGVFAGGTPMATDVNGDGHPDLVQYQSDGWTSIPVCYWAGSGWSCHDYAASYAGGVGAGNDGSGVY